MYAYDTVLDNIEAICNGIITKLNEHDGIIQGVNPRQDVPKIITSMDDACVCINKTKEELHRFGMSLTSENIHRLLNVSRWELKNHPGFVCKITAIDMRHYILYYTAEDIENPSNRCERIGDFLDVFIPVNGD